MTDPSELHQDAIVIDGLMFYGDGATTGLNRAGVDAVNITVCDFEADFEVACDGIAGWLGTINRRDSGWRLIETVGDIHQAHGEGQAGLIMGTQNCRPIGDRLERLDLFHRLGLRIMQLTYNTRNYLGDGCLESEDGGLSSLGRQAVGRMNRLGIAIDLSHVGERTTLMATEASTRPVLVTHANAKAIANWPRNKSDDVIRAVAASGGIIGVSIYGPLLWNGDPSRGPNLADFIQHAEYVAEMVGIEHVSFGTDLFAVADEAAYCQDVNMVEEHSNPAAAAYAEAFDDTMMGRYPADCRGLGQLSNMTAALVGAGWDDGHIRGLLGGNLMRALGEIWV
jgi:membrane dipeptidase